MSERNIVVPVVMAGAAGYALGVYRSPGSEVARKRSALLPLLTAILGYGIRAYQDGGGPSASQQCFRVLSSEEVRDLPLPDQAAGYAEEVLQRGGRLLVRRIADAMYLMAQDATGNIERQLRIGGDLYGDTTLEEDDFIDVEVVRA